MVDKTPPENALQTLRYYAHLYIVIMAQHIKVSMNYRADFFIGTFAGLLIDLSSIGVFLLIFNTVPTIAGWTLHEILFIYWFYKAASSLHVTIFGVTNMWWLGWEIRQGDFVIYYLRPINMLFNFLLSRSDFSLLGLIITAVQVTIGMAYSASQLNLHWTWLHVLFLPISLFSAALTIAGIIIMAASMAFWIMESGPILSLFFKMRDFSQYPLSIFDGAFRVLFTYIIPIGFITFYPAQFFLRPNEAPIYSYLSPLIGIALFALAYRVWQRGVDSYVGTGT